MKKLSALLLATLLLCSLCGCKEDAQNNGESQTTTSQVTTTETQDAQTTTTITEKATTTADITATTNTTTATTTATTTKIPTTEQGGGTKRTTTTTAAPTTTTTTTTTTKATTTTTTANPVPVLLNPKTNIKWGEEYVSNQYKAYGPESIYAGGICFYDDAVDGKYALVLQAMFELPNPNGRKGVTYNGKTYYRCGAGQTPHYMEMTDTEILIKNPFWESDESVKVRMVLENYGNLRVTYSVHEDFKVGDILSISYNGLK